MNTCFSSLWRLCAHLKIFDQSHYVKGIDYVIKIGWHSLLIIWKIIGVHKWYISTIRNKLLNNRDIVYIKIQIFFYLDTKIVLVISLKFWTIMFTKIKGPGNGLIPIKGNKFAYVMENVSIICLIKL